MHAGTICDAAPVSSVRAISRQRRRAFTSMCLSLIWLAAGDRTQRFRSKGACTVPASWATMRPVHHREGLMPEIVFYALGGRSVEQKRALIKDFTDAVVKNYKVDASAVTITIVESSKEDKAKGGVLFSDMGAPKS